MTDKKAQVTVEKLADRDDLTVAEVVQLAEARRALEPYTERIERGGWRVTMAHHVHTHGHWRVSAAPVPNPDYSMWSLTDSVDEATARAVAEAFLGTPGGVREKVRAVRAVTQPQE